MAFNNTVAARAAAGIWGLKLGFGTMNSVMAAVNAGAHLNDIINGAFNDSFATTSDATVAGMVVANLGLTGTAATDGRAYLLAQMAGTTAANRGAVIADTINLFSTLSADATYGAAASAFNARVAAAVVYSSTANTQDAVIGGLNGFSFNLSTLQDNLSGTGGNDSFNAYIFDNANTLQSGDYIDGGVGIDSLYADMGTSANFAVTPILRSIETVQVRAQSRQNDSGDNNVANEGRVILDFERVNGVTRIEDNNSRADLIVEDVRIMSSQQTRDVTIAMVQTDPGNVDFGVYFDQHSLRAGGTTSATMELRVIDIKAALVGSAPLLDSPYDGISFSVDGVGYLIQDATINNAQTYAQLLTAVQAQLLVARQLSNNAIVNLTAMGVTAALGAAFSAIDADTGQTVFGTSILLSAAGHTLSPGNWIASAGVPANSNLYTAQVPASSSTQDLVTSTIVLDDVGRGSNGGDLVVGGLSIGDTSTSRGVDRFEITVERTSRLQNIDSTNNWLKEVTVRNGTTTGDLHVSGTTGADAANGGGGQISLPGHVANHDGWGFNDVRLIDASAMTGAVRFDATVTQASFAKYIQLADTDANPANDNGSNTGQIKQVADFIYSGGAGNDAINVQIEGNIAASNSNIQPGREDFTFRLNGNAGNDHLMLRIVDQDQAGNTQNWYGHQKALANVTIDAGTGDDTIRKPGAGDVVMLAGDGNDTVYADNTGGQALGAVVLVNGTFTTAPAFDFLGFPTVDANGVLTTNISYANFNPFSLPAGGAFLHNGMYALNTDNSVAGAPTVLAREIGDLKSDANNSYRLYKATVTVNFKGLTKAITLPTTTYTPTDLFINQAIKQAVNNDAVLSKLLQAVDGPAYSLLVKALIDGDQTGDLSIIVTPANATTFSASELAAVAAAYGLPVGSTAAAVQAEFTTALGTFDTNADYGTATLVAGVSSTQVAVLAQHNAAAVAGANSVTTSDNTITPGTGNDVIVLGTTADGATTLGSSNDIVVYGANFGNDTIVNFVSGLVAAVFERDQLNLSALGGRASGTVTNDVAVGAKAAGGTIDNDRSIVIDNLLTGGGAANNDTSAGVVAYFTDQATARTHVVVTVDANNVGSVWAVTDAAGTGAGSVTAVLAGTIDLADTLWSSMVVDNFT